MAEVARRIEPLKKRKEKGFSTEITKYLPEIGGAVVSGLGLLAFGPLGTVLAYPVRAALRKQEERRSKHSVLKALVNAHQRGRELGAIRQIDTPTVLSRSSALGKRNEAWREEIVNTVRARQLALRRSEMPASKIPPVSIRFQPKLRELTRRSARFELGSHKKAA